MPAAALNCRWRTGSRLCHGAPARESPGRAARGTSPSTDNAPVPAAIVKRVRVAARRAATFLEVSGNRTLDTLDELVCVLLLERPAALVIAFAESDIEIRLGSLGVWHGLDFHGGVLFRASGSTGAGFAQRVERFHRFELPHPGALAARDRNGGFVASLHLRGRPVLVRPKIAA